jgi:hypothetical protein
VSLSQMVVTTLQTDDRIFAAFALQEIGVLAAKNNDEDDSLARIISMTTELQLTNEQEESDAEKPQDRALIMHVTTHFLVDLH